MNFWESLDLIFSYPEIMVAYTLLIIFFTRDLVLHNNLTLSVVLIRIFRWILMICFMLFMLNTIDIKSIVIVRDMDYAVSFLALSTMPVSLAVAYLYLNLQTRVLKSKRKAIVNEIKTNQATAK